MHSRGYETHDDDVSLASSLSTSNGGQAFDLIAERRRVHEIYAAQYRHDAEAGSLPSGYLPLTMEPQRSPVINPAAGFWRHQPEQTENNRGKFYIPILFASNPYTAIYMKINIYIAS